MRIKTFITSIFLFYSTSNYAITCYYTLAKDSCWTDYNVSVDVLDSANNQVLTTVVVPKGKQWTRQTFACKPSQKLMYIAHFTPTFWEGDAGKTYSALHFWALPDAIHQGDDAWTVSVCYPADFSLVPTPPTASSNCQCDFASIPQIVVPTVKN